MLYGFFVIRHFLSFAPQTPIEVDTLSESFLSTYGITDREREIAFMAVSGLTSREIAGRLVVSQRTVSNHLQHIYDKLGVRSREALRGVMTGE